MVFSMMLLLYNSCIAQSFDRYNKFDLEGGGSFTPAQFLTDQRYQEARDLPQRINVKVDQISDLEALISHNIIDHIFGLSLSTRDSLNFDRSVALLVKFPNLQYLQIDDYMLFWNNRKSKFQLPESIKKLTQLKLIEFLGNKTLDMDDAVAKISSLKNLTHLYFLSYPAALPKQLTKLSNIRCISMSVANMEGLELSNANWRSLTLYGSENKTPRDQESIKKISTIKTLRELTLKYCSLTDAGVLSTFKNLKSLTIYSPTSVPSVNPFSGISTLTALEKLSIRYMNDSTQMINGIQKLINLRSLQLWHINSLTSHPEQLEYLAQLKKLRTLELQAIQPVPVPDIFSNLKLLTKLTVGGYNLKKAINSIFMLPEVDTLVISANKLTQLPVNPAYGSKKLKLLDLQFNDIEILPPAILGLQQLQLLNLANNKLVEIPAQGWEKMMALRDVNFQSNKIKIFPGGLQLIKGLKRLDLSQNQIDSFPEPEGEGYWLSTLLLTGNKLTALPVHIGKYSQLTHLSADFNQITTIPDGLGECKQLVQLKLSHNSIAALPASLRDTKNLEILEIADNADIDPTSVFNVLLSMPRKYLMADLSKINLKAIPESEAWKDMSFAKLALNNNKLTTLPLDFAEMKAFHNLTLNGNPLGIDPFICNRPINNRSDIRILYNELGISFPGSFEPNAEYAESLAERVTDFYYSQNFMKAIAYANKAMIVDSPAYQSRVNWEHIGIARFKTGDYNGAIQDFEQFMSKEAKRNMHWGPSLDAVHQYKTDAHLTLGQKIQAAETHVYFAKHHNNITGFAQAYVMYKEMGNKKRAQELLDTLLLSYQDRIAANVKYKNPFDPSFIVEYAEVLLITDKPADAITLLTSYEDNLFQKKYLSIKHYLLNTALYLNGDKTYAQAASDLVNGKSANGKITGWSFDMFNNWAKITIKSEQKKTDLQALQIAAAQ